MLLLTVVVVVRGSINVEQIVLKKKKKTDLNKYICMYWERDGRREDVD